MTKSITGLENKFSFDHLSSTEFEEFCFELLQCLSFKNVNWRKGTGHTSSPSDQGRDIECERVIDEIDGTVSIEKWFVECKHYKEGVPPEKIQGVLSWANSERPDKILIIASNFLSNSCKNYLDNYERNDRPKYKIRYWEIKNLERITQGQSLLLKKYKIGFDFSFLSIMHPSHLNYIKGYHINTLDFFFNIMDGVDVSIRDKILSFPYILIIGLNIRKPTDRNQRIGDLLIDELTYKNFRVKCYEIEKLCPTIKVANYVIDIILKLCLFQGDITSIDKEIKKLQFLKEFSQQPVGIKSFEERLRKQGLVTEEVNKFNSVFINNLNDLIDTMSERIKENYSTYIFFCDNVLSKLLQEEILHEIDLDKIFE